MAFRHSKNRLKTKVPSPEELKRNEAYKVSTMQDFEKILRDDLKRKRKAKK